MSGRSGQYAGAKWYWPLLIGILYFSSAYLALLLTRTTDGIATVWPGSGVFMAGLLLTRAKRRPVVALHVAIASLLANILAGPSLFLCVVFTIANLLEALVTLLIIKHRKKRTSFHELAWVGRFCIAVIAGTLSGAVLSTFALSLEAGGLDVAFFLSWFSTTTLGMLIVTPLIVAVVRGTDNTQFWLNRPVVIDAAIIGAFSAASAALAFLQTTIPLTFLPFCAVVFATYRSGPLGAAFSIMITAAIGTLSISVGMGTVGLVIADMGQKVWFFQLYLLCLLAGTLPLAALLAAREAAYLATLRERRMQTMAEKSANVGHWVYSPGEDDLYWSEQTYRIHGMDPGIPRNFTDAISAYHPDDRELVADAIERSIQGGESVSFSARIEMPDGTFKPVECRGEADLDPDGEVRAVYGIIQDISQHLATMKALEEARAKAVAEAAHSQHLAETDPLTGVANRRKAIDMLETEIERFRRNGDPLTIALIDVDHFKSINDQYGHGMGDEVLCRITAICEREVRKCDLVGRMGGEEFLVVLPGTSPDGTMVVAERIRQGVANLTFEETPELQVTISIGVAGLQPDADATYLLQAADAVLYQAKREGRNQMRIAA